MSDLKVGQVWRGKKQANVSGFVNDRQIRWIGFDTLQYDGPAVARGRHYPKILISVFEQWAAREVTAELPETGDWATWNFEDRSKNK